MVFDLIYGFICFLGFLSSIFCSIGLIENDEYHGKEGTVAFLISLLGIACFLVSTGYTVRIIFSENYKNDSEPRVKAFLLKIGIEYCVLMSMNGVLVSLLIARVSWWYIAFNQVLAYVLLSVSCLCTTLSFLIYVIAFNYLKFHIDFGSWKNYKIQCLIAVVFTAVATIFSHKRDQSATFFFSLNIFALLILMNFFWKKRAEFLDYEEADQI